VTRPATQATARPFRIELPEQRLEELQQRLEWARPATGLAGDGWAYGVDPEYLNELVAYWRDDYDWKAQAEILNGRPHFQVSLEGIPIHFLHVRSPHAAARPLILTHGWPMTFWDFRDVIDPLVHPEQHGGSPADACHVVVPSLPGYAFSSPLTVPGVTFSRTAELWQRLMVEVLGYDRFFAAGGDWGGLISSQLGHAHADAVAGIHLLSPLRLDGFNAERPWAQLLGTLMQHAPAADRDALLKWERRFISHLTVHTVDHQSLGVGLDDSPVGALAWLLERRRSWSDCDGEVERCFSRDELLTHTMLYWATGSMSSSLRLYAESNRVPWIPTHDGTPVVTVPTGVSLFRHDLPPGMDTEWLHDYYNLVGTYEHDRGGHFPMAEQPRLVVDDLRATFRGLRTDR
jgi:pimeloyl-ACP methyl ester carboxylesterase